MDIIMKTIFLADNEGHVRRALRLAIEQETDFVVIGESEHTESLLAQVCQNPPDLILLDYSLPGANHIRLIRTIRQHCPNTLLVFMSVKPEVELITRRMDGDGFLSKQLNPDEFIEQLTEFFT